MNLRQLLDASAAHDAEYGHNLASHLPMALVALNRLGADEMRLTGFAERYSRRLHPAPPAAVWPGGDAWPSRLGDPAAWPAYRALFSEWFDHEGAPSVLPQVLPRLMQGVGAAAFHGPIRVAYALAAGHSHELSDALAYWACRWFSVTPAPSLAGVQRATPVGAAAALGALRMAPMRGSLIAERMALASQHPEFSRCVATGRPAVRTEAQVAQSLRTLAELAATLYAASGNFTVLHLVTSAHAVRTLLRWLDDADPPGALVHYWAAYVAGCAASGLDLAAAVPTAAVPTATTTAAAQPLRAWPALVEAAVASDDDHLIKIVDVCREEQRHYGGTLWQAAASRAVMQ
ncbi:MAG: questin oxidase family protein [Burkholderiaceae bacterium]